MSKVMMAMSGGVDSSVAALLLGKAGYSLDGVTGKFFSRLSDGSFSLDFPISASEGEDARKTCERLGIGWRMLDMRREFFDCVLTPFARDYLSGQTPNPCALCNPTVKLGRLYERAICEGYDYVATGHYARIEYADGRWHLKKAADPARDQSYFLYAIPYERLEHILFPLGTLCKDDVRGTAEEAGLNNARKKDSQDICFVSGDYLPVLEAITGQKSGGGDFVDATGRVLGRHKGIAGYTIGQRKGLGLALPEPMYVINKRTDTNEVVLGYDRDLYSSSLVAHGYNALVPLPEGPFRCEVKIRSTGAPVPATACSLGGGRVKIDFETPQRAIACGQAAVLYLGDEVLGGGAIAPAAQ